MLQEANETLDGLLAQLDACAAQTASQLASLHAPRDGLPTTAIPPSTTMEAPQGGDDEAALEHLQRSLDTSLSLDIFTMTPKVCINPCLQKIHS